MSYPEVNCTLDPPLREDVSSDWDGESRTYLTTVRCPATSSCPGTPATPSARSSGTPTAPSGPPGPSSAGRRRPGAGPPWRSPVNVGRMNMLRIIHTTRGSLLHTPDSSFPAPAQPGLIPHRPAANQDRSVQPLFENINQPLDPSTSHTQGPQ